MAKRVYYRIKKNKGINLSGFQIVTNKVRNLPFRVSYANTLNKILKDKFQFFPAGTGLQPVSRCFSFTQNKLKLKNKRTGYKPVLAKKHTAIHQRLHSLKAGFHHYFGINLSGFQVVAKTKNKIIKSLCWIKFRNKTSFCDCTFCCYIYYIMI